MCGRPNSCLILEFKRKKVHNELWRDCSTETRKRASARAVLGQKSFLTQTPTCRHRQCRAVGRHLSRKGNDVVYATYYLVSGSRHCACCSCAWQRQTQRLRKKPVQSKACVFVYIRTLAHTSVVSCIHTAKRRKQVRYASVSDVTNSLIVSCVITHVLKHTQR